MRKPRILRIINRLNLGGPTFNVAYLTKYLESEFETLLVSGMIDEAEESSEFIVNDLGLTPMYLPEMYRELNPFKDYKSYFKLRKIINDFRPDIVHTHAAKAGAVGRLAASHSGVEVIVHTYHGHVFHGYFSPAKTRFFLEIERYLARQTSKLIALSPKQKEELSSTFDIAPASKFEVVHLGFNLDKFLLQKDEKRVLFRDEYHINDNEIAIGIIGRLVPIKNHEMFLRGFKSAMQRTNVKLKAVIIGDGEERSSIEALIDKLELKRNGDIENIDVILTGWRKDIDVCNAGLDILCLTSKNEGTPVSLIEAQAAGLPIVSTRVGGIEDIVIEGKSALLCENNDVDAFSNSLVRLINDANLRIAMKSTGTSHVMRHFTYQRLCSDMSTLYKSLLGT